MINDPSNDAWVGVYLIRDDAYTLVPRRPNYETHNYRYSIDGRFAIWGVDQYVQVSPDVYQPFMMPSGSHVLGIADYLTGHGVTTSPAVEARPPTEPTHTSLYSAVVFFGGASGMNSRVLINDPTALPAGTIHLRVMNALSDHQPVQIVQCPSSVDTLYTAGDCAAVGDPIAYGGVYETNATPDVAAKLGYYWAAPGVVAPAVTPIYRGNAAGGFITRIPTEVMGPQDTCPSCILNEL